MLKLYVALVFEKRNPLSFTINVHQKTRKEIDEYYRSKFGRKQYILFTERLEIEQISSFLTKLEQEIKALRLVIQTVKQKEANKKQLLLFGVRDKELVDPVHLAVIIKSRGEIK